MIGKAFITSFKDFGSSAGAVSVLQGCDANARAKWLKFSMSLELFESW
jgi:hypothetical protein